MLITSQIGTSIVQTEISNEKLFATYLTNLIEAKSDAYKLICFNQLKYLNQAEALKYKGLLCKLPLI